MAHVPINTCVHAKIYTSRPCPCIHLHTYVRLPPANFQLWVQLQCTSSSSLNIPPLHLTELAGLTQFRFYSHSMSYQLYLVLIAQPFVPSVTALKLFIYLHLLRTLLLLWSSNYIRRLRKKMRKKRRRGAKHSWNQPKTCCHKVWNTHQRMMCD